MAYLRSESQVILTIKKLTHQRFFLWTASCFGLLYLLFVPPFQVPDEGHHLFRAYHIASGHWYGEKTEDARFGGTIATNLNSVEQGFRYLRYDYGARIDREDWLAGMMVPLQAEKVSFADFPNVAYYVPFPYLLQALVLKVGITLGCPPLGLLYMARLTGFALWLLLIYTAIRWMPFHKLAFSIAALFPSCLFLSTGMTADSFTYGLCYLLIAYIIKLAFGLDKKEESGHIGWKAWSFILMISLAITLSKVVYLPLLILAWLIPKSRFRSYFPKLTFIGSLLIINLIALFILYSQMKGQFVSYANYNPAHRDQVQLNEGVDPEGQLEFILSEPCTFAAIAFKSHLAYLPASVVHCIGKFGWEKNYLPFWLVGILLLTLLIASLVEPTDQVRFTRIHRMTILLSMLAIVGSFTIVIYMQWSPLRNETILSLGGRYYLPLVPLCTLLIKSEWLQLDHTKLTLISRCLLWVAGGVGVYAVLMRYWI